SSSGRAPNPARRNRCSTWRSAVFAMSRQSPGQILVTVATLDNVFFPQLFPDEPAREPRHAHEKAEPHIAVGPPSHGEVEDEPRTCGFTIRARDNLSNSAAVREQVALNPHGITQLCANFVIARAAIAPDQIRDPTSRVEDGARRK